MGVRDQHRLESMDIRAGRMPSLIESPVFATGRPLTEESLVREGLFVCVSAESRAKTIDAHYLNRGDGINTGDHARRPLPDPGLP